MKVTSAEANKLLKQLEQKKLKLIADETNNSTFRAAVGEDVNELKPGYSIGDTQAEIAKINRKIYSIKHKLNVFNTVTEVVDGLTIDQVLVHLPQLNERRCILNDMRMRQKKKRYQISGNIIDYVYTSYDPEEADRLFKAVDDKITRLQLALDNVNNTVTLEI